MDETGLLPMGASSRKLSRVGRGCTRGTAIPYVNDINSSAGNITYIPGSSGAFRTYSIYTFHYQLRPFEIHQMLI